MVHKTASIALELTDEETAAVSGGYRFAQAIGTATAQALGAYANVATQVILVAQVAEYPAFAYSSSQGVAVAYN